MTTQLQIRSVKTFRQIAEVCSLLILAIALIVMVGWGLDWGILARFKKEYIPMAPSTALAFILISVGLFLHIRWPSNRFSRRVSFIAAIFVSFLGFFIFVQFFAGFDFGFEQWLSKSSSTFGNVPIGRMSPITAASFLLAGLSLLFLPSPSIKRGISQDVAMAMATGIVVANSLIIIGYWYRVPLIFGGSVIPVALP